MNSGVVAGTIVAKNYLAYARVWARSFREHHPGARVVVLLADRSDGLVDPSTEPFDLMEAEDLGIPAFRSMAFRYDVMELSTAVKPAFLQRLLATGNEDVALYFDPDIIVLAPVSPVIDALRSSNVALTPHALSPIPLDGRRPTEAAFLVSGTYNLGFIGVRRSDESSRMLSWWNARLVRGGASAPEKGLFTDQKWIDLAPAFFAGVEVLRDPTLNVAYWNLHERGEISRRDGTWLVSGERIRFFHFSGFVPDRPEVLSKHQDRFVLGDLTRAGRDLFALYSDSIWAEGHAAARTLAYAYGKFDDGDPVAPLLRATFRRAEAEGHSWRDPFRTGPSSFREWAVRPTRGKTLLPPFAEDVWQARPDVRAVYPRAHSDQAAELVDWVRGPGAAGLGIGPGTRAGLDDGRTPIPVADVAVPAESPGGRSGLRALQLLLQDPPLAPEAVAGYRCPPGSARTRVLSTILGTTLYRRLRYRYWCWRFPAVSLSETRPHGLDSAPPHEPARRPAMSPASATGTRVTPVEEPFGVNLFGYLDTESGIAEVARCFVRMLEAEGVPVAPITIPQEWLRRQDRTMTRLAASTPFPVNLFFVNADQLPSVVSARRTLLDGRRSVGYWFWELEEFPPAFDGALGLVDEVWVASSFCQRSISSRAEVPVVRIPPSLPSEPWPGPDRKRFGFSDEDFVFLFVFDAASFVRRKNPGAAVAAFRKAFPEPGRELLFLKTTNATARQVRALERLARGSRVRIVNGYAEREELLALHASVDACLSLHRSEGLGLTLLEAMACRKPVIATAYGGCEDFLRPDAAQLVPYRRVPLGRRVGPYPARAFWAEPDVETAARLMLEVASDPSLAARIGAGGRAVFDEWAGGAGAVARRRLERLASLRRGPS